MKKIFKILTETSENPLKTKFIVSFFLFLMIFFILILHFDKLKSETYITVKFSESGPLHKNMPVYYKGYKIGKVRKIELAKDYKNTLVKIVFFPRNPKISEDVIIKVKRHDILRMDYIALLVPEGASNTSIQKGDTIEGEGAFDMDAFFSEISDADLIVPLLQSFTDTVESINKTSKEAGNSFTDLRSIIKDNRGNIKQTTKELSSTTKSLNQLTSKLNISLTKTALNNTTNNVDKSSANILEATKNIKDVTENINKATKNLDKTVEKIDCTITETNSTLGNLKVITKGFRKTLGKRFAGLRIIFGKTIECDRCLNNCCK